MKENILEKYDKIFETINSHLQVLYKDYVSRIKVNDYIVDGFLETERTCTLFNIKYIDRKINNLIICREEMLAGAYIKGFYNNTKKVEVIGIVVVPNKVYKDYYDDLVSCGEYMFSDKDELTIKVFTEQEILDRVYFINHL